MHEREELIVDGFQFGTQKDAEVAAGEKQKAELLESRMEYGYPDQVFVIYEKAIENRVFQTPVGYTYLKKLQEFLLEHPLEGKRVRAIPLYLRYSNTIREKPQPAKERVKPAAEPKDKAKARFMISVFLNILLVCMVGAMFLITLSSDTPNMINYRNAIVNENAAWEEALSEREEVIRDKERALGLE